jgi:hypothetical protein
VLLSGRWATVQLHINNLTSLILLSHIVSLPISTNTESNDSLSEHCARTGSAHSRRPPSPTDQCLSVTSPLPSLSLCSQHFIIAAISPLRLDGSHGQLHLTRPSLLCPIPPASQSSRHPIACYSRVGGHGWEGSSRFGCGEAISWDSPEMQGICMAGQDA